MSTTQSRSHTATDRNQAQRFHFARTCANKSLRMAAEELGLTGDQLYLIEEGRQTASPELMVQATAAYGCTPDWLDGTAPLALSLADLKGPLRKAIESLTPTIQQTMLRRLAIYTPVDATRDH